MQIRYLAFMFLVVSVFSLGIPAQSFATSHNIPPLTVETDQELYAAGYDVLVTGSIKNPEDGLPLTLKIIDPNGNLIGIDQFMPGSDGTFLKSYTASGPLWKSAGEYTIKIFYGSINADVTFEFTGGTGQVTPPPPPPPVDQPKVIEPEPIEPEPVEPEPVEPEPVEPEPVEPEPVEPEPKSGRLIATATFGSEMAPQVQLLREIRDNVVLGTNSGTSFMNGFNEFYYSFSPTIADWERQNPVFKETVKVAITPLLASLSILNYIDIDSEAEMLGYGISLIMLNIGMYFIAPVLIVFKLANRKNTR